MEAAARPGEIMLCQPGEYIDLPMTCRDLQRRAYDLHVPFRTPEFDSRDVPLVFVLHGGGGTSGHARWQSKMNAVADRERFIVCYPNALTYWETGAPAKVRRRIDDVGFCQAIAAALDPPAIYVAGISNGAHFALRLASEWSDVKAVAVVAGIRKPGQYGTMPTRPIPLIAFHGLLDDTWAPVGGGQSRRESYFEPFDVPSACDAANAWGRHNGCAAGKGIAFEHGIHVTYAHAKHPVELYLLSQGGHSWPGGRISPVEEAAGCGPVSPLEASPLIGRFFRQHSA
jgi:polyhydroxybutyrate depolymerase